MPRKSDENRSELQRWARHVRTRAAVLAVRDGQAVIAAGLRRRCPIGATHRLIGSIHPTRVGIGPHSVGGFVNVGMRYAVFVEGRHPFIGPTARRDGPRAMQAMIDTLQRLI